MKYPSTKRLSSLKDPSPWYSWADWHFSEKIDGTCVQIVLTPTQTRVLSRSGYDAEQKIKDMVLGKLVLQEQIAVLLGNHQEIIVFGEAFGHGIQGQIGQEYGALDYRAFAVLADGVWWNVSAEQWFVKELGLEFVPEIPIGKGWGNSELRQAITILEFGDLSCVFAPTKLPEGIIARPRQTLLWPEGSRVLFKLKSEEYYKGDPQNVMDLNFRRTKKDNKS